MNDILEVRHLVKCFGDVTAVDDLSFRVREGELFAFLGVNGAGKSTTIHILCGQLARDGGSVCVCGADPDEAPEQLRRSLGVVFQSSVLDQALSVQENLRSRAALYGIRGTAFSRRLTELTDLLELGELLRRPVGKLSGGQRRRIDIARALLHRPRQCSSWMSRRPGLDPQTRSLLWQVVAGLRQEESLTVFLTTHYMEEAADAGYVVLLDHGRIAAEGTPLQLKNTYAHDTLTLYGVGEADVRRLGLPYAPVGARLARHRAGPGGRCASSSGGNPALFRDFEAHQGHGWTMCSSPSPGRKLAGGADEMTRTRCAGPAQQPSCIFKDKGLVLHLAHHAADPAGPLRHLPAAGRTRVRFRLGPRRRRGHRSPTRSCMAVSAGSSSRRCWPSAV